MKNIRIFFLFFYYYYFFFSFFFLVENCLVYLNRRIFVMYDLRYSENFVWSSCFFVSFFFLFKYAVILYRSLKWLIFF